MPWWRKLIDALTAPSVAVVVPRERINAQVHAGLLLVMFLGASASGLTAFLPGPGDPVLKHRLGALGLGVAGVWLVLYLVCRTRHFRVAISVWLVVLPLSILVATVNATVPEVVFSVATSYLLVTIGSAVLSLQARAVALVVLGCTAVAFAGAQAAGLPGAYSMPVIAFLLSGTAIVLANGAVARASEREATLRASALEQETTQRKLAESQSGRLQDVIERADELIVAFSEELDVLEANLSARTRLGLATSGGSLGPCFPEAGRADLRRALEDARRVGQWSGTLALRADARELLTSAVLLAHPATAGRAPFFSGIFRDVSLERRLRHLERMDSIGQLAGGVAHDFNNALMAIVSAAEALRPAVPQGDAQEDLDLILTAATRSAELTRKLLTLSRRSDVGSQRRVELAGLLEEVAPVLRRTLPRTIEVQVDAAAGPFHVLGDPVELEHLFLNLALNARDAMPQGGRLRLAASVVELDAAFAAVRVPLLPGPHVKIDVTDSGEGMTADVAERVFEPFFTTKRDGKGTGLGLASVFGTVRAHRGHISVTSAPGQGSTFTLLLPLAAAEARPAPLHAAPATGLRAVLVIDDDPLARGALCRALAPHARLVLDASSGEDGVRQLEAHQGELDAVVLDLVMPGMDGGATFAALRQRAPALPVVLVSGFTHDVRVTELLKAERVAFVPKPVQVDALRVALGRVIAGGAQPG